MSFKESHSGPSADAADPLAEPAAGVPGKRAAEDVSLDLGGRSNVSILNEGQPKRSPFGARNPGDIELKRRTEPLFAVRESACPRVGIGPLAHDPTTSA